MKCFSVYTLLQFLVHYFIGPIHNYVLCQAICALLLLIKGNVTANFKFEKPLILSERDNLFLIKTPILGPFSIALVVQFDLRQPQQEAKQIVLKCLLLGGLSH